MNFLDLVLNGEFLDNFGGEEGEDLRDVVPVFGTSFHKLEAVLVGEVCALLGGNLPLLLQVALRADQNHVCVGVTYLPYLLNPRLDVAEAVGVRD